MGDERSLAISGKHAFIPDAFFCCLRENEICIFSCFNKFYFLFLLFFSSFHSIQAHFISSTAQWWSINTSISQCALMNFSCKFLNNSATWRWKQNKIESKELFLTHGLNDAWIYWLMNLSSISHRLNDVHTHWRSVLKTHNLKDAQP